MKKILFIVFACGLTASPAMADLVNFHLGTLQSSFDGVDFSSTVKDGTTTGNLTRLVPPVTVAEFNNDWSGLQDFTVDMKISGITAGTAQGVGTFELVDKDGDILAGEVSGTWLLVGVPIFYGVLSDVDFTSGDNEFDGDTGVVSMDFGPVVSPWNGTLIELTAGGLWFKDNTWEDVLGGSVDATVVPIPGAILLGFLGLGAAGLKLRKYT